MMTKGPLIGEGRTAEVYAWQDDSVLKLYHSWWPLENVEYEARIARAVYDAGVDAPWVGPIVEVDGRHGLIYERIDGRSMAEIMLAEPHRADEFAAILAEMHVAMHAQSADNLPDQRLKLQRSIELVPSALLSDELKQRALDALASLPDRKSLCHGDFHPLNVLLSSAGPRVIDWDNASLGNPLADVARTSLLLQTAHLNLPSEIVTEQIADAINRFREVYLRKYITTTGADARLIEAWQLPIAAARLNEGIEVEEDYLLAICARATEYIIDFEAGV